MALCKKQKKEGWAEWRIGRGIMSYKGLLWWAERSQVHQVTSLSAEHLTIYKGKWDLSKEQEAIRKAHTVTGQSVMSGDQFFSYAYWPLVSLFSQTCLVLHFSITCIPRYRGFTLCSILVDCTEYLTFPFKCISHSQELHVFTHFGFSHVRWRKPKSCRPFSNLC